jgi:tRNA threonylcarbamoyladenosine biosynthesis protein TsaB
VILVLDTATRTPVVALANDDGTLIGERRWQSHHRHGEELLQQLDELLRETGKTRTEITAVVVGTGPGSFTGLRIGLATAKTIAYALNVPIVGVSSTLAMAAAAAHDDGEIVVTLPAGASDRYVHAIKVSNGHPAEKGTPELVADAKIGNDDVAVDLDQAPASAVQRGESAVAGVAGALARLGSERLASGTSDDVAQIVPAYFALPRGIAKAAAEMEWSPDLR